MAAAIHTLDTVLQPPNPQRSLEATVMLASLRAHPRPGVSSSDVGQERARARELFDRVNKELEEARIHSTRPSSRIAAGFADDFELHAEIARLWQEENADKTVRALSEALRITEASGQVDSRVLNNLGALRHMEGNLVEARTFYENALTSSSGLESTMGEGMSTTILYNLARVYEDEGEDAMAKDAYDKLLSRHPEYVDGKVLYPGPIPTIQLIIIASIAKIRQAQMLINVNRNHDALELLKEALSSQSSNLNLRAFYTYFLIQTNSAKQAKDFVFATLKDHDKYDVYSLCASGWIMYHQSRENRDTSSKALEERKRGFQRSAEFYEKALQLDPLCAVAAQGLAIVTAEDALGSLGSGVAPVSSAEEAQKRMGNGREALDVFAKVRESINDGSVYLNMGHCYYSRDEFDRAIESVGFMSSPMTCFI